VISMLFFVLNNVLAIYISISLSRLMTDKGPGIRWLLIAITNFAFLVYAAVITTGCVGILSSMGVMIALIVVAVCVIPFVSRQQKNNWQPPLLKMDLFHRDKNDLICKISLILFLGFAVEWVCKSLILGTYFGPDDVIYHASIPAQWIVDGKITLVPFSYQAYYPFNAELMSLWFMLPFGNDTYASITSFYWGLLSLVAIITIHRSLGYSIVTTILVMALFLSSSGVQGTSLQKIVQSFSANDLAGPSMLLTAAAFLLSSECSTLRDRLVESLYCGLIVGFAVGIKISFAPFVLVIGLWFLLSRNGYISFKQRMSFVLLFILGIFLTSGFWYIRNIVLTGNPLFPAAFGPLNGPFGLEEQNSTKLISWIINSPTDLSQWFRIAQGLGNWPLHFGVLSIIGYITALHFLIKNRLNKVNIGDAVHHQTLLLITGLLLFFTFFILPFSATINRPNVGLGVANRYVIFSFTIGLILLGRLIDDNRSSINFWKIMTLVFLATIPIYEKKPTILVTFAIAAAIIFYKPLNGIVIKLLSFKRAGTVLLITGFACLVFWYPVKKKLTDKNYYSSARQAAGVFRELENLPDTSRIGYFSTLPYNGTLFYRLFGRRLQMIPIPLDYNGSVPGPLHTRWPEKTGSLWEEWDKLDQEIDTQDFQSNIQESAVQYVIVTKFPYNRWPVQYNAFKNMEDAIQIYNDGYSVIWKVGETEQL